MLLFFSPFKLLHLQPQKELEGGSASPKLFLLLIIVVNVAGFGPKEGTQALKMLSHFRVKCRLIPALIAGAFFVD